MKNFVSYMATQTKRVNSIVNEVQKSHEQIISLNDELISMMHIMQATQSNLVSNSCFSFTFITVVCSENLYRRIGLGTVVSISSPPTIARICANLIVMLSL